MIKSSLIKATIPNLLTFFRIILTVAIVGLLVNHHNMWAFALFILASLTDLMDGFLARLLHQESEFGAWLDSFADNIFNLSLIFYFFWQGEVPLYYLVILILRDGLQFIHSLLRIGVAPKWMISKGTGMNRWEPSMVFFVLLFLFVGEMVKMRGAPIFSGIDEVILPYVFMPLSALTNLIISVRFFTAKKNS